MNNYTVQERWDRLCEHAHKVVSEHTEKPLRRTLDIKDEKTRHGALAQSLNPQKPATGLPKEYHARMLGLRNLLEQFEPLLQECPSLRQLDKNIEEEGASLKQALEYGFNDEVEILPGMFTGTKALNKAFAAGLREKLNFRNNLLISREVADLMRQMLNNYNEAYGQKV